MDQQVRRQVWELGSPRRRLGTRAQLTVMKDFFVSKKSEFLLRLGESGEALLRDEKWQAVGRLCRDWYATFSWMATGLLTGIAGGLTM